MGAFGDYIKYLGERVDQSIEKRVRELLPRGRNIVYLDLGCDDGKKTLERARVIGTKKVIGIEVEETRAKKAEKRGIKVYRADLNKRWSLKEGSVDVITATEVVEHLVDVDNFFSEARRVLSSGGRIIISTDNLAGYHNVFALLLGNQPYTGPYLSRVYPIGHRPHAKYYKRGMSKTMQPHLNVMTAKALRQLLTNYGFESEVLHGLGFYPFPPLLADLLAKIDKYHASHCLVMAEK